MVIAKGLKKYLINPSLGLLSSILYLTLFGITQDIPLSLMVSIIFSVIAELAVSLYSRTTVCGFIFLINFLSCCITLIIWFIVGDNSYTNLFYVIIYEIIFFLLLLLSRLIKVHIDLYFGDNKPSITHKTYLNEYFEIAQLTQYFITFHIFIVIIYKDIYEDVEEWEFFDVLIYLIIPITFFLIVILYQEIKTRKIVKHLRMEEWLPIVSESGEVTGRIAKSVSTKMKNKFMHPVVRVALVHNGELYLQQRPADDLLNPLAYDHPFEKYMLFNHEINMAVRNSITKALNMQELPFKFLLKYVFENDETKRLIFLFVAKIENEQQLKSINLLNGKFWTMKQIEDSFEDEEIFSECFQLEYEYLKNTALQADLYSKKMV